MKSIKKTLTELLGHEPGREMTLMILKEVKESGKCIEEVADKYALPPMFIMTHGRTTFEYNGEVMTPAQFHERFPFRRFVTIKSRQTEQINK